VDVYMSSSKNTRKTNSQPILNKNLSWANMESEFDMLGLARKLVKYVVHSSKKIKSQKLRYFSRCPRHIKG
jgi:hypothetical protein